MSVVPNEAEKFFHSQIPITRAMGVRVVTCDEAQFIVEAPVGLNRNHLRTAFGGSINAVATLAGYGLLWSALRERNAHVVIGESSIRFLRPVREMIRGVCLRPGPKEWTTFNEHLDRSGAAPITLKVSVSENGEAAAEFRGIFVARFRQI